MRAFARESVRAEMRILVFLSDDRSSLSIIADGASRSKVLVKRILVSAGEAPFRIADSDKEAAVNLVRGHPQSTKNPVGKCDRRGKRRFKIERLISTRDRPFRKADNEKK